MLGLNAGETSCTADHPPLTADDDRYALLSTPALMIYLYLKGSESEIEIQRWNSVSLHCLLLSCWASRMTAGLAAYPSWVLTVQALSESRTPALFTDFCEEAAVRAEAMLSSAQGSMQALPCTCNPFQSPVSCMGRDNRLPSFPNAFLLGAGPAMLSREAFA